ncbi:MAG: hypothetical protein EOO70_02415 [Myxococcaceae bacterium]|nr:MAG: hypothetical protein EOO70_02415 [Myxococcaceae bacterium]
MTAQIQDVLVFEQRPLALRSVQGTGLFDPRQQGLEPRSVSTAYYRGFDCLYRVDQKQLLLDTFRIGLNPLDRLKVKYGKGKVLQGHRPHLEGSSFLAVYEQLGWHVLFNGGLVVARGYIPGLSYRQESVVNSASSPIWMFSAVHELHFVEGLLVESFDCSSAMEVIRNRIQARVSGTHDGSWQGIHQSLMDAFRRDYPGLQW